MALHRSSLSSWYRHTFGRFLDACSLGLGALIAPGNRRLAWNSKKRKLDYTPRIDELEARVVLTADITVAHGHTGSINLLGSFVSAAILDGPSHGSLNYNSSSGMCDYTAGGSYVGDDSFTYSANDGVSDSDPATITVSVTNAAPVANGDSLMVQYGHVVSVNLLADSSDADGDPLTVSLETNGNHGGVSFNSSTGLYEYTPAYGYIGADSFTYSVNDGLASSNSATVNLTVATTPVANDDNLSVAHGHTGSVNLLGDSSDPAGNALTVYISAAPSHGSVTYNSSTGLYDYTASGSYLGSDSFTYFANNGFASSNSATVTISVTNAAPVANTGSVTVTHDHSASVNLFADYSDADGDPLTASILESSSHGSLAFNSSTGLYDYTPASGYTGADSFSYWVNDGFGWSNVGTVNITVGLDAPVAADATLTVQHGHAGSIGHA